MATWFIEPLINDRDGWKNKSTVHKMDHPVYLIIEFLLSWSNLLMNIYMGYKCFDILCPFGKIFHILLRCLSCQFSNHALSKSLAIHPIHLAASSASVNNHTSVHFSFQTCMTMCSAHCEHLSLSVSFSAVSERYYNSVAVHFWMSGTCIAHRTISKTWPSLLILSQLIIGHTPHEAMGSCLATNNVIIGATSSCNLLVPSGPAKAQLHIPFPFDNRLLLSTSYFMTQWVRHHSAHDKKLRSHGNLVAHWQMFSF